MTRDEVKSMLPIVQAFADGKAIQFLTDSGVWKDFNDLARPNFSLEANRYRIKPSPKYRPFKDAEECWQEMQKHQPFGWLRDKADGCLILVTKVVNREEVTISSASGWSMEGVFKYFNFADGAPFGVLDDGGKEDEE